MTGFRVCRRERDNATGRILMLFTPLSRISVHTSFFTTTVTVLRARGRVTVLRARGAFGRMYINFLVNIFGRMYINFLVNILR